MERIKFQREKITLIHMFDNGEVNRMLRYYKGHRFFNVRNQFIMILFLDTGIRNFELCELRVSDVRDTYIHIMGKGKKVRHVPITPIMNK